MKPNVRFLQQSKEFWAHVRTISQQVGYVESSTKRGTSADEKQNPSPIKVPTIAEILTAFDILGLSTAHLVNASDGQLTPFGETLLAYFGYRAEVLNTFVAPHLMRMSQAQRIFLDLYERLSPTCYIPMNKQKGEKKAPQFFTGIINMLVEANADGLPCDFNPGALTTVTRQSIPVRTLSRRVDGAFTSTVNPVAVWEVKEYYYTTTFGSRVADGVYETLVDGMELEELRKERGIDVQHLLMVDDHFTWWVCGRSYLCRIIDMLHLGYVDEVLFGSEVSERLPTIVREWATTARSNPEPAAAKLITPQQARSLAKAREEVRSWIGGVTQHPEFLTNDIEERDAGEENSDETVIDDME